MDMDQEAISMPRQRTYSRGVRHALALLGKLIRAGRIERGMTAQELAERAGVSRTTLSNIEKGAAGPEIGIVFEVAAVAGVRLFDADERILQVENARLDEKLALLPRSVRPKLKEPDDDF
jgi:transcriptional regulator with XRE-family HTH domain